MMTINQIDQLKNAYAEMIVEGMDMNSLITFAVESIEQNLKNYDMNDIKEEIIAVSYTHLTLPTNREV